MIGKSIRIRARKVVALSTRGRPGARRLVARRRRVCRLLIRDDLGMCYSSRTTSTPSSTIIPGGCQTPAAKPKKARLATFSRESRHPFAFPLKTWSRRSIVSSLARTHARIQCFDARVLLVRRECNRGQEISLENEFDRTSLIQTIDPGMYHPIFSAHFRSVKGKRHIYEWKAYVRVDLCLRWH